MKFSSLAKNGDVILTKFSSLASLEVVILTTSSEASDENFVKLTFPLLCCGCWRYYIHGNLCTQTTLVKACFNSLWIGDDLWHHKTGSSMVQLWLGTYSGTSHYLNHCKFIINETTRNRFKWLKLLYKMANKIISIWQNILLWNRSEVESLSSWYCGLF